MMMVNLYCVQIYVKGEMISERSIEAPDALSAINLVEADYGEPPQVEYKTVQHEDGRRELALVVSNWHGYSFMARRIKNVSA